MKNIYDEKSVHIGLLILRIGIGTAMIFHGYPKLLGGPERWETIGSAVKYLGINFGHQIFGFMAGLIEAIGGILLIIGLFHLPVTFLLFLTLVVALISRINLSDGFLGFAHPLEVAIVFLTLLISGPGYFSLDKIREK